MRMLADPRLLQKHTQRIVRAAAVILALTAAHALRPSSAEAQGQAVVQATVTVLTESQTIDAGKDFVAAVARQLTIRPADGVIQLPSASGTWDHLVVEARRRRGDWIVTVASVVL